MNTSYLKYLKVVLGLICSLAVTTLTAGDFRTGMPGSEGSGDWSSFSQPMLVNGKVVLDDGTPPYAMVPIQLVCHGEPRLQGYTDANGNFNVELGRSETVFSDASAALASGMRNFLPNGNPAGGIRERDLADCELRASLAGFRSDAVSLSGHGSMDRPDVGAIVLYRLANVEGFTISATSGLAPKDARNAYEKGLNDIRKNRLPQAAKEFEKAVASYPRFAPAWFELGRIAEQHGRVEEARKAYTQALAADPKYIWPYERLSLLAVKEKNWPEVATNTDRIIRLNPYDFGGAYFHNAVANLHLGKLDVAEKSAREALKLDTPQRLPMANYVLGLVLAQKHIFAESAGYLRTFLSTLPKGSDAEVVKKQLDWVETLAQAKPDPEASKHSPGMGFR